MFFLFNIKRNVYFSFLIIIGALLTSLIILRKTPQTIHASSYIYEEHFDNPLDASWHQNTYMATWDIENNMLVGKATKNSNGEIFYSYIWNIDNYLNSYNLEGDINGTNSVDKNIMFDFDDDGGTYVINIRSSYASNEGNDILIQKCTVFRNCPVPDTLAHISYVNAENVWYHFKIVVANNEFGKEIKLYINNEYIGNAYDKNPLPKGGFGFGLWPNNHDVEVHIDNLTLSPISMPTIPPIQTNLIINPIYQTNLAWTNAVYDHATTWAKFNPTIGRWGCALTSSVMNLRYNNHDISVDKLNNWLIEQKDGYIKEGYLNWLAIARFSRQNIQKIDTNKDLPTLEYKADNDISEENIKKYLDIGIPPIIKVPGHFIISKGYSSTEVLVNDPASENNTYLSQVINKWGEPKRLDVFTPSHTDLSYLMFIVEPESNIEIHKLPENTKIDLIETIETPLIDPVDSTNTSNLKPIKIIYIEKPIESFYKIKYQGNKGNIESYTYDTFGNVFKDSEKVYDKATLLLSNKRFIFSTPNTIDSLEKDIKFASKEKLIPDKIVSKYLLAQTIFLKDINSDRRKVFIKPTLAAFISYIKKLNTTQIDSVFKDFILTKCNIILQEL